MKVNRILLGRDSSGGPLRSTSPLPHRILVVDDDRSFRFPCAEALARSGYAVDTAEDGAAAWVALNTDLYDLLITNHNLAKGTGVELLKRLRAARMCLPVIMTTGTLPSQKFTHTPWLKPAAILLQPYTPENMLRTVKKVLRAADRTAAGASWFVPRSPQRRQSSQTDEPPVERRLPPVHSAHRILVIEEDRDLRDLYFDALAGDHYHVDGAEDGAAGWEALRAGTYHLLITENDVPKLTGVELVRRLRAARMALPVVMAAARLPTQELARNPSLQLAATLLKPFPVDELLHTVESVLRAREPSSTRSHPLSNWRTWPATIGWQLI